MPLDDLTASSAAVRSGARSLAVRALSAANPGSNFDWGNLLDTILDNAEEFGGWFHPAVPHVAKIGKMVKRGFMPTVLPLDRIADVMERGAKSEAAKVEKAVERKEGLYTGTRAASNMVRRARVRPMGRDMVVADGCDVITSIDSGTAGFKAGEVIAVVRLNPLAAGAVQLRSSCARYEQYSVRKLSFHLPGGTGTTVSGTIISFYDYDPDDLVMSGASSENIRVAMTHAGAEIVPLWKGFSRHFNNADVAQRRLFISDNSNEPRLTDAGKFLLVAGQAVAPNVSVGPLFLDWEIGLHVRSDDNEGPTGEGFYLRNFDQAHPAIANSLPLGPKEFRQLNAFGLQPMEVNDWGFVLPAGSYIVTAWAFPITGQNFLMPHNDILVASEQAVVDASYSLTGAITTYGGTTGVNGPAVCSKWFSCSTSLTIQPFDGLEAGTEGAGHYCFAVSVVATCKGPLGVSLKELIRVQASASRAETEAKLLQKYQQCRDQPVLTTSQSTSSATSSSAPSVEGKEAKVHKEVASVFSDYIDVRSPGVSRPASAVAPVVMTRDVRQGTSCSRS